MSSEELAPINEQDFKDLKERMKLIVDADPKQYQNDFSLRRYLRAFKTTDDAFQAILNTNKWRETYGVDKLADMDRSHMEKKARVLRHRDCIGRPVIYIPVKNHSSERDIDELTRFIVYNLEEACKKCFEEVTDRLCIVFDLAEFSTSCMEHISCMVQNLVWLLGKHFPERLGVCLIINSPTLFSTVWPAIRVLLDDNTAKKVKFVADEVELCQYLIPDILPTDM